MRPPGTNRPLATIGEQRATFCFKGNSYLACAYVFLFVFLFVLVDILLFFGRCFLFGLRGCLQHLTAARSSSTSELLM